MTWKTALMDLPYGGAKGGIAVDPKLLSENELERLTRKLVQGLREVVGPHKDIPAPDMNTGAREMAWFFDEFSKFEGFSPAVVTGKPVHLHGSLGREAATGRGVVFATGNLLAALGDTMVGKRVVIQGFGNVGSYAAEFYAKAGAHVVAISDVASATSNPAGLDITALKAHAAAGKALGDFSGGNAIAKDTILMTECDILVPAALGGVIGKDEAAALRCKYVIEAANGPTTPAGDAVLRSRGIPTLPDIYSNGGGVTVSFFEWVQNLQNFKWEEEEVNRKLEVKMKAAFATLWATGQEKKVPLRTAALCAALLRVTRAHVHRGFN